MSLDKNTNSKSVSQKYTVSQRNCSVAAIIALLLITFFNAADYYSNSNRFSDKIHSYYFSDTFYNMHPILKIVALLSYYMLSTTIWRINALIYQRMSVPEMLVHRWKTEMIKISTFLMISSFFSLTIGHEQSKTLSLFYLGLVENVFYVVFLVSSLSIALVLFNLVSIINFQDHSRSDKKFLELFNFKIGSLFISFVQVLLYVISLLIVSYYTPSNNKEHNLINIVKFSNSINSIIYLFTMFAFNITINIDYEVLNQQLANNLDLEYFVDEEEDLVEV